MYTGVQNIVSTNMQMIIAFTRKEQKQHASASAIVEEVLSSIRTVVAFGGEHAESIRYIQVCHTYSVPGKGWSLLVAPNNQPTCRVV